MCLNVCLHECMCTTCMSGTCRGQKKASELQTFVSCPWVLGTEPGSFASAFNHFPSFQAMCLTFCTPFCGKSPVT